MDVLTSTLAKNASALSQSIVNFEQISSKINNSNPNQLIQNMDQTVIESKKAIQELSNTLTQSQKTLSSLNQTVNQLNEGQGTLGN